MAEIIKIAFRTALNCQSCRCSLVGGDKPLSNGVILYVHAEFEGDLGNVVSNNLLIDIHT